MKTIPLSRPERDHDVRFRYSNRAGTSTGGSMLLIAQVFVHLSFEHFFDSLLIKVAEKGLELLFTLELLEKIPGEI